MQCIRTVVGSANVLDIFKCTGQLWSSKPGLYLMASWEAMCVCFPPSFLKKLECLLPGDLLKFRTCQSFGASY